MSFLTKNKERSRQFLRYFLVGSSSTVFETAMFLVFSYCFGKETVLFQYLSFTVTGIKLAQWLSLFIAFWYCFVLNRRWSFKSHGNPLRQLLFNTILLFINMYVTGHIVSFLITSLSFPYVAAKVFTICIAALWNFVLYRKVIYK